MNRKKYTSKRDRFLEVGENRVNALLRRIKILGNCSNKNLYEYREEEIEKIFDTINKKLNEERSKFKTGKGEEKFHF